MQHRVESDIAAEFWVKDRLFFTTLGPLRCGPVRSGIIWQFAVLEQLSLRRLQLNDEYRKRLHNTNSPSIRYHLSVITSLTPS